MSEFKVGDLVIFDDGNVDKTKTTSIIKPYTNTVYSDDWVHVDIYGKSDLVHVDNLIRDPLMDLLPILLEI